MLRAAGLSAILASNPSQPDRQGHREGRGAGRLGRALARGPRLHAPLRRVLLALRVRRPDAGGAGRRWRARRATSRRSISAPIVLFDGLTKNWRYPGWRVTWTIGPREGDRRRGLAPARFLDGGGSKPMQRAADRRSCGLDVARAETKPPSIKAFTHKRDLPGGNGLQEDLGVTIDLRARRHVLRVGLGRATSPPGSTDGHVVLSRRPRSQA